MQIQRYQLILTWLQTVLLSDNFGINFLPGDASFRRYARIHFNNGTLMLMDAPPDKENCTLFVEVDEFFAAHNVRVPHIVEKNLEQGFLLLEDFGNVLLSTLRDDPSVLTHYEQSLKQLIQIQSINGDGVFPVYKREKLISEMNLITEWLLPSLKLELNSEEKSVIEHTFSILADAALAQPQVIVHRDFHSRNLMIIDGEQDQGVIDFQDAVIGPDTYDLISITRDAYVQFNHQQVIDWFKHFYDMLPASAKEGRSFNQFRKDADFMAVQRHLKILGIFVRLFERDGKSKYLKDLPRVMWYLLEESEPYAELKPFMQLIRGRVLPKFKAEYGAYNVIE